MLVLGGTALLAVPPSAGAHDVLVATSPAGDAVVDRLPEQVVLTFDAPAQALGTALVVTGPTGPVQQGAPALVDTTVRQSLRGGAPAGEYRVAWRVTSADGHPVSGEYTFTTRLATRPRAGDAAAPAAPAQPGADSGGAGTLALAGGAGLAAVVLAVLLLGRRRRAPTRRAGETGERG